jgi:HEAT repeat protein
MPSESASGSNGFKLPATRAEWYLEEREESNLRDRSMKRSVSAFLAALVLLFVGLPAHAQNNDKGKEAKAKDKDIVLGGKSLKQWLAEFHQAKDPAARIEAMQTLSLYGNGALEAVPDLVSELSSRDPSIKVNALLALGYIGVDEENAQKALSAVMKLLGDNQQIVRYRAILLLAAWGPGAKSALPQMLNIIKDTYNSSWEVRRAAALALGAISHNPKDAKDVPDARVYRALTDALNDASTMVRLESLSALFLLGPPAVSADRQRAIQSLLTLAGGKDKSVAVWAHVVLTRFENNRSEKLTKAAEKHLQTIARYLKHSDPAVRMQAARALGMAGPNAKGEVPDLIEALRDKELTVVAWSIAALKEIGASASPAVPSLEELTKHQNEGIRKVAKEAIDAIGKDKGKRQVAQPGK